MKTLRLLCLSFLVLAAVRAQADPPPTLVPSQLDPATGEAREKLFTAWINESDSCRAFADLNKGKVPIYNERKPGAGRDLYIPNPGLAYCVQGNLSADALRRIQQEKVQQGDEMVSAVAFRKESGETVYWALWVPRKRASLIKEKMLALGVTPAQADAPAPVANP